MAAIRKLKWPLFDALKKQTIKKTSRQAGLPRESYENVNVMKESRQLTRLAARDSHIFFVRELYRASHLKSANIPVLWAQLFTPLTSRNTENNESDTEVKCLLLVFRGTQAVKDTQAGESVMADDYLITVAAETNISILSWSFTPTAVKD